MGASESKPSSNTSPHQWKASTPTGISHDLVESLQTSHELTELQIQARVAEELKRLQAKESEALKLAHEKIAAEDKPAPEGQRSREAVAKEIEALRAKLSERKKVRELPESVETARGNVVRCLLEHDRRPLDCWKEVEAFKEEVKRLEKGWVEKVVS
ncbi:hypothetical protein CSUB01_04059 [Colletotrichum sublineola]|uniref:DUF1690 domain-containing protein n=1 Tax=Colletotrichum sublineola TaxID=1173701 RepID=A0A066XD86_COLSU|nr:hypothetical protein CSUB01_04059 [Colletotrichum sublineola]